MDIFQGLNLKFVARILLKTVISIEKERYQSGRQLLRVLEVVARGFRNATAVQISVKQTGANALRPKLNAIADVMPVCHVQTSNKNITKYFKYDCNVYFNTLCNSCIILSGLCLVIADNYFL